MLHRIKFRIHGGPLSGKFVFNVREGTTLYLNEAFRPSPNGPEFAYYCFSVRNQRTTAAVLRADGSWNGAVGTQGPVEIHAGHTFEANGLAVEVLECPEVAVKREDREVTRFIDIQSFQSREATPPETAPSPALTAPPSAKPAAPAPEVETHVPLPNRWDRTRTLEAPPAEAKVLSASVPTQEHDVPDRIVVPIQFDTTERAAYTPPHPAPTPTPVLTPLPTIPASPSQAGAAEKESRLKTKGGFFAKRAVPGDPAGERQRTYQRAGILGAFFAVMIWVASVFGNHYQINLLQEEEFHVPEMAQVRPRRPHPQSMPLGQPARSPASATATPTPSPSPSPSPSPAPEANAAPIPLPAVPINNKPTQPVKSANPAGVRTLTEAIDEGNVQKVSELVEAGTVSPDFALDELGRSPFVKAASAGRVSIMQYLLSKSVSLSAADYNGNNALMWATINGHEKTVKFLLSLGLDPNVKRDDGKSAFQLAHQYRQNSVAKLLAEYQKSDRSHDRKPGSADAAQSTKK